MPHHRLSILPTLAICILCAGCGVRAVVPAGQGDAGADSASPYANVDRDVDRYKETLARHVVLNNREHTFTGPLPPVLPAIVVLRMSVDKSGRLSNLFVQRSIDDVASRIAMASVERSGRLPSPSNLLAGPDDKLTFSETFLFNKDYRFQVRSLAQPQPSIDD